MMSPPIKFCGSKRWLVPRLAALLWPYHDRRLVEPFAGSAAVSLALWSGRPALINDINPHLARFWRHLQLGRAMARADWSNTPDGFAAVRREFNERVRSGEDSLELAQMFYWLNKTGYNGLIRFNRSGELNTPFGHYPKPGLTLDAGRAAEYSTAMAEWGIGSSDFENLLVGPDDVLYVDPPYLPVSKTAAFTAYSPAGGFGFADQQRLREWLFALGKCRIPWIASNSYTPGVLQLYRGCVVERVDARRSINCKAERRGPVPEALIYPRWLPILPAGRRPRTPEAVAA